MLFSLTFIEYTLTDRLGIDRPIITCYPVRSPTLGAANIRKTRSKREPYWAATVESGQVSSEKTIPVVAIFSSLEFSCGTCVA